MSRRPMKRLALALALLAGGGVASAQDLLIRNATVHTASARGTLPSTDVLVKQGRIAAIGSQLPAGSATVVDAQGKPLTPALFGGITDIGVEEVSGESATVDNALALGSGAADMRAVRASIAGRISPPTATWVSRSLPISEASTSKWTTRA